MGGQGSNNSKRTISNMAQFQPFFDATNIPPEQGGAKHPVGSKFPAIITNTGIKSTKDNTGGYFFVTFTTQAGQIDRNYNIWNDNAQAVEIAQKQLSALLHSVGIFRVHCTLPDGSPDMQNAGIEIRNQRVQIDVNYQKGQEPNAEKPSGGYVEVSKVYDANGNEPGKAPVAASQAQNGGWNNQAQPVAAAPANAGWSSAPATQNNAPAPAAAPAGGWQPGPSAPANAPPPWANK